MSSIFPDDIQEKAQKIIQSYAAAGLKIVTAESCTGGLIAGCLTDVSGSSAVVERGFVTYSNEAKAQSIGVPEELIVKHGAVSAEVAEAMAIGALEHSLADVAISVTGIAGPTGGSTDKPVGLVFLAIVHRNEQPVVKKCLFESQNRTEVRLSAVRTALDMLTVMTD
ncbi:CinA family protein [Microvirga sp. W0021]|uniref:CinA family protein n=1 Tax=Hohaiivirga grylli TaxID=3133970 RepID=A0ABV0BIV4_9HYPH